MRKTAQPARKSRRRSETFERGQSLYQYSDENRPPRQPAPSAPYACRTTRSRADLRSVRSADARRRPRGRARTQLGRTARRGVLRMRLRLRLPCAGLDDSRLPALPRNASLVVPSTGPVALPSAAGAVPLDFPHNLDMIDEQCPSRSLPARTSASVRVAQPAPSQRRLASMDDVEAPERSSFPPPKADPPSEAPARSGRAQDRARPEACLSANL
jgi:hypothetical protein